MRGNVRYRTAIASKSTPNTVRRLLFAPLRNARRKMQKPLTRRRFRRVSRQMVE
jgi:hypothetical protein